jgi:RecB family endonuclease NucS
MKQGQALETIRRGLLSKNLLTIFGNCAVDYVGRATSVLPSGKRLILIKGDDSISIHQNRLVKPTNYMVKSRFSIKQKGNQLVLMARKSKPTETLTIIFDSVDDICSYDLDVTNDLRLAGSERDLNDLLMQDLSMIESGLKPLNQQQEFGKGIADIIAEDRDGNPVVIELKRREADYACVSQLQRYMKQIEKLRGRMPRGILLAPSIRPKAREMLEELNLEFARLDFVLKPGSKEKACISGLQRKQTNFSEWLIK